jgi:hypothetical protein
VDFEAQLDYAIELSSAQTENRPMSRLEYLKQQYEAILDWYKQSEEKAQFLVTINTVIAGIVNGLVFLAPEELTRASAVYTAPVWILLILSGLTLIGSCVFILRAVWARHRGPSPALKPTERLWFFGDIAAMTREEHHALVREWSEEQMEATMTAQNHILAGNVRRKFDALNMAISLTIASLILLFALGFAYAGSR